MGDGKYRLVTDPSEGPKLFQIDTRVTSRGETAVLLTGIDCAERVVCHEAVSFDLAEGEFVFRLGAGNAAAVLDQLLQQGALLRQLQAEHLVQRTRLLRVRRRP